MHIINQQNHSDTTTRQERTVLCQVCPDFSMHRCTHKMFEDVVPEAYKISMSVLCSVLKLRNIAGVGFSASDPRRALRLQESSPSFCVISATVLNIICEGEDHVDMGDTLHLATGLSLIPCSSLPRLSIAHKHINRRLASGFQDAHSRATTSYA